MKTVAVLMLMGVLGLLPWTARAHDLPPIQPVEHVDLPRFMGDWYLIATIPTRFEKDAWNAVEVYRLRADGNVDTSFHFREGSFDGKRKQIHAKATVKAHTGNAVWGVQVFWPFKAQYIVAWLNNDYSQLIVARDARDYVWVMARTPTVSPADYKTLIANVAALGYDMSKLRKVPQRWPAESSE